MSICFHYIRKEILELKIPKSAQIGPILCLVFLAVQLDSSVKTHQNQSVEMDFNLGMVQIGHL
jgi:hypothetical protein